MSSITLPPPRNPKGQPVRSEKRGGGRRLGTPNPEKAVAAMVTANKSGKVKFAAKVFPIIEEIKSAGVQTLRGICQCLNARGVSTRNGKNWYPATVRNILKTQTA